MLTQISRRYSNEAGGIAPELGLAIATFSVGIGAGIVGLLEILVA